MEKGMIRESSPPIEPIVVLVEMSNLNVFYLSSAIKLQQ